MLSLLHHPNLVNLIGYCADGDQRLLVYEYMPLGSLEDHLHGKPIDIFLLLTRKLHLELVGNHPRFYSKLPYIETTACCLVLLYFIYLESL